MAHQGKRMISEDLLAAIEAIKDSGVTAADLIAVAEALKDGDLQGKLTAGNGIAIDEDNEITYDPETAAPLMENIVDSNGNKRFIEGNNENLLQLEGVNIEYTKWSLSGSHLMIVIAGNVDNNTVIPLSTVADVNVPEWILNKIYPIQNDLVSNSSFPMFSPTFTVQNWNVALRKDATGLHIRCAAITLSDNRSFRIQFDLLIDNE